MVKDSTQQDNSAEANGKESPEPAAAATQHAAGQAQSNDTGTPSGEAALQPEVTLPASAQTGQPPKAAAKEPSHAQQVLPDPKKEPPKVGVKTDGEIKNVPDKGAKKKGISAGAIVGIIMLLAVLFGTFMYLHGKKKKAAEKEPDRSKEPLA